MTVDAGMALPAHSLAGDSVHTLKHLVRFQRVRIVIFTSLKMEILVQLRT